jgi:hypothetical protein
MTRLIPFVRLKSRGLYGVCSETVGGRPRTMSLPRDEQICENISNVRLLPTNLKLSKPSCSINVHSTHSCLLWSPPRVFNSAILRDYHPELAESIKDRFPSLQPPL